MVKTYDLSDLGVIQQQWVRNNLAAGIRAMRVTAERARGLYADRARIRAFDTGRLASTMMVTNTPDGAIVSNPNVYMIPIDHGRRAGAKAPPFQAILEWVLRKRLTTNSRGRAMTRAAARQSPDALKRAESIAWAIRASIKRKGIKPRELTHGSEVRTLVLGYLAAAIDDEVRRAQP